MSNLIVGFSKAKSSWKIGSTVIQKVDCRDYSHCYIRYVSDTTKVELIAQASHGFVNLVNKSIFLEQNIIVKEYAIDCAEHQTLEVRTFIDSNLGKPYSKLQLALIGIKKLLHIQIKYYDRDASYICSEFASRVCQILNINIPEELDYITPSDLDNILYRNHVPQIEVQYEVFL